MSVCEVTPCARRRHARRRARSCRPSNLKSCAEGATSDRYAGQLFDGRQPGRDLRDAVVPERAHALRDRRALELLAARLRGGEALQRLAHLEQLIDADPALVAGLVTARAAALAVEGHPVGGG